MKAPEKNKIIAGFNYAIDGIITAVKSETNMKIHVVAAILALIMAIFLGVNKIEITILAITITLVITAELFNTAIETVVNMVTEEYNEKAKIAKDVAAGAVLVTAINSVFVAYLVFFDKLTAFSIRVFQSIRTSETHLMVIVVSLCLLLTLALKALFYNNRGTHVQGGTVSGHSALSFAIATIISCRTTSGMIILLVYFLAFLVAESRVEGGIHQISDVIFGGILGSGLALIFFKIFTGV